MRPWWRHLYTETPLAFLAIGAAWLAGLLAWRHDWLALIPGVAATVLALLALRRGLALGERGRAGLRAALAAAAARNRALDHLHRISTALLGGRDVRALQDEVARAVADLLDAEGGAVMLLVEEGRFLQIVSATGPMAVTVGRLMPSDASAAGWVVAHGEPLLAADLASDPRIHRFPDTTTTLHSMVIAPLRSAGIVVGTVSAYNRLDGQPFGAADLNLLQALGDQVVLALDRAASIDEIRTRERELASKNRELERAGRLKSEFLANMSHELRTPLNAIIGFSDLLLTEQLGPLNDTQRDFLGSVLRNGRHLLGLINDVLDLSKIEAGRMTLELGTTDVGGAIDGAVTDTASLRAAKGQECRVRMEEGALTVLADAVRVRQILFNLLSNASKFTPEGGQITLTAIRTRAPLPVPAERQGEASRLEHREAVWIAVTDTGIGIAEEDMPKLFKAFSQVDSALSRREQGTGLGLALCKQFVEMHGGTIGAESIHGRGSTFWFILPVDGPVRRG